ncbi:MAG TPA: CopD family protein [Steroidobacteraceae bacterium]|nr:CopD family protein [Steroidobacteraceae bacterium]
MSPDTLSVLLRAASFVALLQAAGVVLCVALFSRHLPAAAREIRSVGVRSAAVALPLLVAQLALEAPRMAGEYAGILDGSLQRMVLGSPVAAAAGARVLGALLIAAGLPGSSRPAQVFAQGGVLLIAGSFALTGHTAVHPWRWLLAPALVIHLLIAAFWLGGIATLYLATLREGDRAGRGVEAFSRVALWIVPLLAVAGVVMTVLLVPHLAVFAQPYGWLLLVKMSGFVLLMGLAAANRWRLGPAVAAGATRGFRRSLIAEYLLIAAVLAATAVMTSLYSP